MTLDDNDVFVNFVDKPKKDDTDVVVPKKD